MNGIYHLIGSDDAQGVIRDADGAIIPPDTGNRDWVDYLAWVAEGNTPDPAPVPPPSPEKPLT
jgi:hypothetical protein